ncbi:matrix remodeling-associated protein 8 isoform X3 [Manis pentadactyla]|uniref:matrix remodeling-associated protein 8 isoform X3 n=1 Tax=Manis pentadactyla TaxID=143292 RepID=UPI00255C32E5|nr:matrix remodeling-associated protein 8 isoform X3 [Manis pentadactyla]
MELGSRALLCKLLLLQTAGTQPHPWSRNLAGGVADGGVTPHVQASLPFRGALALSTGGSSVLLAGASGLATAGSSVVSESVESWASGARAVLRCQSQRMVWTQDRLHDRQRVVHWDLGGGPAGGPARRLVDMYSAGEQRVYEPRDRGRLLLPPSAFQDGNFSLLIRGLAAGAHWDGEKEVLVAERGAPALLTCVNRAPVWTDRHVEEAQQVVHWDRQPPGVPHDRADRLLDLYASGERRAYGPPFLRDRMAVGADAFARGDFSLRIDPLEPADEGTYSCHLHHHYCGLHERRIFHLRVTEPAAQPPPRDSPGNGSSHSGVPGPDPTLARGRSIINVIVPEGRAHFFQQLGYVLATLLLFILLLITVVLATRQRRRGGYEYSDKKSGKAEGKDMNMAEFAVATGDQALCRNEDIQLDYKNNILKERAGLAHNPLPAKNIDLDKEFRKEHCR